MPRMLPAVFVVGLLSCSAVGEEWVKPLISVSRSINIEQAKITSADVAPGASQSWSIEKIRLHGGKQEGVDLIVIDNGRLQITVIPTRGMGVLRVKSGDVRLGWDSPVKEVVNPAFINLQARGGLGWLDGFNEWMVRCGMESNGHPGTDKFINNVGDPATMELTLHGKVANIPASEVEVAIERNAPYRIHVRGRVNERMFYGPKLELQTDLSTEPGSNTFRVDDVITNHGSGEQEFEILYHTNYGRPLLEEGSTFVAPVRRVAPFNAHAAEGIEKFSEYDAPDRSYIEKVYCMELLAGPDGRARTMLRNKNHDRAIAIRFSTGELPYFTLWKNTAAEADGYVTGLEPGTNYAYNRRIERASGRVPSLAPGQSRHFGIEFAVLAGAPEVQSEANEIGRIQAAESPTVLRQPTTRPE